MSTDTYVSPLSSRYASKEMRYLFSADKKFTTWRRLWVALARAENALGLNVTAEQIAELEAHIEDIDYEYAAEMENKLRHDVMAHVHAYGKAAPGAMPIIHLGATSCYVGDNADIIIMREALELVREKLLRVVAALADFAEKHRALPTLGFTHFQPAQLVTVGKRACLWINDLMLDLAELTHRIDSMRLLGSKGATGTQASFMELFGGDHEKIKRMEAMIAREMGFDDVVPVSGQTYSRKEDYFVLAALSGVAQSAAKFASDMRLLSHLKECEEPFEKNQVGSSAMPYKRNPMRCERICSLARYVVSDAVNAAQTSSAQWFERTLDDSANKRISVPEAFLAVDAILNIYLNVASGIVVYPRVIERRIRDELPFLATENIMMRAAQRGGDRQELHEAIRVHSVAAGAAVKERGEPNDLIRRIAADPLFGLTETELEAELEPRRFIGRAPEQTEEYLRDVVRPALAQYGVTDAGKPAELRV
ncbi:MAG: adenylosuccinate lyase [Oscillospiraceae bacterium]|jgi:adenylosuccinate lyase|nr:adenylosuccinate lyase [Oscillospiraceae bacterium]